MYHQSKKYYDTYVTMIEWKKLLGNNNWYKCIGFWNIAFIFEILKKYCILDHELIIIIKLTYSFLCYL